MENCEFYYNFLFSSILKIPSLLQLYISFDDIRTVFSEIFMKSTMYLRFGGCNVNIFIHYDNCKYRI